MIITCLAIRYIELIVQFGSFRGISVNTNAAFPLRHACFLHSLLFVHANHALPSFCPPSLLSTTLARQPFPRPIDDKATIGSNIFSLSSVSSSPSSCFLSQCVKLQKKKKKPEGIEQGGVNREVGDVLMKGGTLLAEQAVGQS